MIIPVRFGLFVSLIALAQPSFADNLVSNPDFSQLITGWAHQPESAGSIAADFSHGSPGAPSAHVSGTQESPTGMNVSSCIEIDGPAHVDFTFNALVVEGSVHGEVWAYADTACTQPATGVLYTETKHPSSEWTTSSLIDAALPANTRSAAIRLHADNVTDGPGVGTPGDAYFDHIAFGPTGTLPQAISINQEGLGDAWYDPSATGQGFQFSITPAKDAEALGALFGAWYTYDTLAGATESQRWYSLQASLGVGARSADVTIYQNIGGTFMAPPAILSVAVGTGTLAFDSCTSGTFVYTLDDGRAGNIALQALLPNPSCAETGGPPEVTGLSVLSGAWYNAASSGQGVLINVESMSVDASIAEVFVGWYTYAMDADYGLGSGVSGQRWFSAAGSYGAGSAGSLVVYESTGGTFGSGGTVKTVPVGTATLSFASCDDATLDYTFTDGELAGRHGTIDLSRLGVTPAGCELTP